jgi:hypothetical protein
VGPFFPLFEPAKAIFVLALKFLSGDSKKRSQLLAAQGGIIR